MIVWQLKEIIPQDLSLADVEQAAKDFIIEFEQNYNVSADCCYIDDNYYTLAYKCFTGCRCKTIKAEIKSKRARIKPHPNTF